MKLKAFLNMTSCKSDCISICKDNKEIYKGTIEDYLKYKKSINGVIKEWLMYVENCDYPVLEIAIK